MYCNNEDEEKQQLRHQRKQRKQRKKRQWMGTKLHRLHLISIKAKFNVSQKGRETIV